MKKRKVTLTFKGYTEEFRLVNGGSMENMLQFIDSYEYGKCTLIMASNKKLDEDVRVKVTVTVEEL